jgi:RHS repeat-associated protein
LQYDADYRVSRITATSTPHWDYVYHYDAVGNIDQLTDQVSSNDREYAYDPLNRLLQDKKVLFGTAGLIEYQYDLGGNRTLWKQLVGQAQLYAVTSNRQTQYGSTLLGQDSAGNLTSYGAKTFSYDSANRMKQSVVGSTTTAYRYNGLGQRTTKLATTGATTVVTHYSYASDGKYLGQTQLNPDGTYAQGDEYIWLDDTPIAQVHTVYGTNNAITSQQLTYIHADHLNTPRAMTDASKKIVWKWESEAYGRTAPNGDPDGDGVQHRLDLRFPGQIADAETGFYYNMNRYYDPMMGRYTQSDPIGLEGGLNTYGYVGADPIKYFDIDGLQKGAPMRQTWPSPYTPPSYDRVAPGAEQNNNRNSPDRNLQREYRKNFPSPYDLSDIWQCAVADCSGDDLQCTLENQRFPRDWIPDAPAPWQMPEGCRCLIWGPR